MNQNMINIQGLPGADAALKMIGSKSIIVIGGNFLGIHPFLSQETTSRNTISHSRRHWELGRNLQESIIFSKFAL